MNLPTITNGAALAGFASLPLVGISPWVPAPALTLFVNSNAAANVSLSQGPDKVWSLNWDTTHLTNGAYSIQVAMQYGLNSSTVYGSQKTVTVSNAMTFDQLTSQFTGYGLIIDATLNGITNAGYALQLSDDFGNPLVYGRFSTTNGKIQLYWDLTDGHGHQLSFGNIQATFTLTNEDVDPPPITVPHWWYREGNAPLTPFTVAWGSDSHGNQFSTYNSQMIQNGVIDILANPSDINAYNVVPWPFNNPQSGNSFRYNTDSDKQLLITALQQSSYFFWLGHGGYNTILGDPDLSNLSAADIQNALGNLEWQSTPRHPKTNSHPYTDESVRYTTT